MMSIAGTGIFIGRYSGIEKFKGKSPVKLIYVHLEGEKGEHAVILAEDKKWKVDNVKLGELVVIQYSVVESEGQKVFVLENILQREYTPSGKKLV
jgi:hypothetical protein